LASRKKVTIDNSFHFNIRSGRYETKSSWAQVSIKKDNRRGDFYIDVLFGEKNSNKPHLHMGINADQSSRFIEHRGVISSIQKDVDSKLEGHVKTEKAIYNAKPVKGTFTFKVNIDEPTRTIKILFDEVRIEDTI